MTTMTALRTAWAALEARSAGPPPGPGLLPRPPTAHLPPRPRLEGRQATAARLPDRRPNQHGALPADPRQRWRCLFVDEIDQVVTADRPSPWETADNYNPSHPFPAIDEVTIAVTPSARYSPS